MIGVTITAKGPRGTRLVGSVGIPPVASGFGAGDIPAAVDQGTLPEATVVYAQKLARCKSRALMATLRQSAGRVASW
jgi:hypothetical protein